MWEKVKNAENINIWWHFLKKIKCSLLIFYFFKRSTFVGSAWSFSFFIPATMANDLRLRRISIPDFIHYIFCLSLILEKEPVLPFLMLSAKQGHYTGTIFITSLVWWIEPGTSRTRSQYYTTRLSRRRSLTGDWTRDLPHSKPVLYH